MPDATNPSTYHLESLARGLAVLSSFSEEKPALSLTEISHNLKINKTTALRILSTLEALGYLRRDPDTKLYRPGLAVFRLGFIVLDGLEVRQIASPYLKKLAQGVSETINLVVLDDSEVVYIDRFESRRPIYAHRAIGTRLPVYCTATGKALLAFLSSAEVAEIVDKISWVKHTDTTVDSTPVLLRQLRQVRQSGFATNDGELVPELRAVAAPIFQSDGQVVAAVNITVPSHRMSIENVVDQFAPELVHTCRQISEAMGFSDSMTG
jgi:DNA-binding IclR family transcriptional regulator